MSRRLSRLQQVNGPCLPWTALARLIYDGGTELQVVEMAIAGEFKTTSSPTVAQRIWSDPTCLLLIFAGGSAEFAVHPNVDWLFFTGKLPADPIGRFFSTIDYLRQMLVVSAAEREPLARSLRGLHTDIEERRGGRIPDIAYRDVLSMDIYYSIVASEVSQGRAMSVEDRDDVVSELVLFGDQMGIPNLPTNYAELCEMRRERFADYGQSEFTGQLLSSYRKALGFVGYRSLLATYPLLLEPELWKRIGLSFQPLAPILKLTLPPCCRTGLIHLIYRLGLPSRLRGVVREWKDSTATTQV